MRDTNAHPERPESLSEPAISGRFVQKLSGQRILVCCQLGNHHRIFKTQFSHANRYKLTPILTPLHWDTHCTVIQAIDRVKKRLFLQF